MDIENFLRNSLENFVAVMPQLIVMISMVYYGLRSIDKKTGSFSPMLKNAKNTLQSSFGGAEQEIKNSFNETRSAMAETFEQANQEIRQTVDEMVDDIQEEINGTMQDMQKELASFDSQLTKNKEQTNMLVLENKAFMDTISVLLAQDPDKIREGVSTIISQHLNVTKEELEQYPEKLVENLPALEQALKDTVEIVGQKNIDALLEKMGYERKEE